MRERSGDTGIAIGLALLLHLAVLALLYFGWRFGSQAQPLSAAGPPIEATLIMMPANGGQPRAPSPPAVAATADLAAPAPQPLPEPAPQDAKAARQPAPQAPQAEPDTRNQERAADDVASPKPPAPMEQERMTRQEQVDLTQRERQDEVEEQQRRSAQQLERLRQLAAVQQQRQQAAEQSLVTLQNLERLREVAAATPAPTSPGAGAAPGTDTQQLSGNHGTDTGLEAAYRVAIRQAIERNWRRPETVPLGQRCRITITQIPGGDVINASVDPDCPYDLRGQESLKRAVMAAAPLPYVGFESVFRRQLNLNFEAAER